MSGMRDTDFPAGEPVKELTAQLGFRMGGSLFPHLRLLSSRE
jgi:hypothetical protein